MKQTSLQLPPLFIAPTPQDFKHIWLLAWPLIISNLSVPLLGLVDSAIMGHLNHARYLGAVSLGAIVITFIYWGFGFLRMGTVGLTAQAYGAQNKGLQWQMLYLPTMLALTLGLLILLLSPLYLQQAVNYMQASDAVAGLALEYLSIRIFSAPAVLCTYVAMGWLLGRQDSRGPLVILVITNVSNIVFNLILVWGYDLKSTGVAWGSLLADYVGFAVALWLVWRQLQQHLTNFVMSLSKSREIIAKLLNLNGYLFMRTLLLLFVFAFVTAQSAKMGTNILAANTLLLQFVSLFAYFLDGFAHAAEASCGAVVGRKNEAALYRAVNAAGAFSLFLATLGSLGFYVFHLEYLQLLTSLPEVVRLAQEYALWIAWIPLMSVWSYLMDGVFVGTTQTKAMLHSVWIGVCIMLIIWTLVDHTNHNLWLTFILFGLVRAVVAVGLYLRIRSQRAWW